MNGEELVSLLGSLQIPQLPGGSYLQSGQESSSVTLRSIILMRIDNHRLTGLCGMHKTSCKSMELLNPHYISNPRKIHMIFLAG